MTTKWLSAGLVATASAHFAIRIHHHRQLTTLAAARMHQQLLAAQIDNPVLQEVWPGLATFDVNERAQHLHRNAWLSAWEAMYGAGVLSGDHVRATARSFLADTGGQTWWKRVRDRRAEAATGGPARRFHRLIDAVYQDETGTL